MASDVEGTPRVGLDLSSLRQRLTAFVVASPF